jgi:hypothetical protein
VGLRRLVEEFLSSEPRARGLMSIPRMNYRYPSRGMTASCVNDFGTGAGEAALRIGGCASCCGAVAQTITMAQHYN